MLLGFGNGVALVKRIVTGALTVAIAASVAACAQNAAPERPNITVSGKVRVLIDNFSENTHHLIFDESDGLSGHGCALGANDPAKDETGLEGEDVEVVGQPDGELLATASLLNGIVSTAEDSSLRTFYCDYSFVTYSPGNLNGEPMYSVSFRDQTKQFTETQLHDGEAEFYVKDPTPPEPME